ncbi:MAG: hypothetical protein IH986_00120 [Planctomycetes bacterium]|nr:hypothetical protein [Planctomycetota bacterium]
MKRATWIAIGALMLCGCAPRERAVVLRSATAAASGRAIGFPNLALGPTADHARLAEVFATRSSWPSVETGYRLGEVSNFFEVIFDEESFHDRLGGGFYRGRESFRSGVLIR